MPLIKRRITQTESVTDKFRRKQREQEHKQQEEEITKSDTKFAKIKSSKYWPIIEMFFVNDPVKKNGKDFWTTKSFDKGMTNLRRAVMGTLFNDTEFQNYRDRKFTIEEIISSLSNHKLALKPEYKPFDKKFLRVSFDQFFFNPFAKNIGKSLFLYWLINEPIQVYAVTDLHSEITEEVISLFKFTPTDDEKHKIIAGVKRYMSVLEQYEFEPVFTITNKVRAKILYTILYDLFSDIGIQVKPENFVSPRFEGWLYKGLVNNEYVKGRK